MDEETGGFTFWNALLAELAAARARRGTLTYCQLIERLALPSPAMALLTAALERLAARDACAGRPLRAALVVSQAGSGLQRPGFFQCAAALGACAHGLDAAGMRDWHAVELERVFACTYPET